MAVQVDAMEGAGEGDVDALMHQPLGMEPRTAADLVEQRHRALLQHAGADARQHMRGADCVRG